MAPPNGTTAVALPVLPTAEERYWLTTLKRLARRRTALFGIEDAGRWALVRRPAANLGTTVAADAPEHEVVEHIADTLLRRYPEEWRR